METNYSNITTEGCDLAEFSKAVRDLSIAEHLLLIDKIETKDMKRVVELYMVAGPESKERLEEEMKSLSAKKQHVMERIVGIMRGK